jgi:hypothetical protein
VESRALTVSKLEVRPNQPTRPVQPAPGSGDLGPGPCARSRRRRWSRRAGKGAHAGPRSPRSRRGRQRVGRVQPAGRGGHGHGRHDAFSAAVASSCVTGPSGMPSGKPVAARPPDAQGRPVPGLWAPAGSVQTGGGPQGGGLAGPAEPHTIRTGPRLTPIPLVGRVAVSFPPQLAGSEGQRRA